MAVADVIQVRNIGIVGQGGAGKTSLADAILFNGGATNRLGSVNEGTSNFDFEPEEVRRQLSLSAAFHHTGVEEARDYDRRHTRIRQLLSGYVEQHTSMHWPRLCPRTG